jgi:hypothetical protein
MAMRVLRWLPLAGLFILGLAVFTGAWILIFEVVNHYGFDSQVTPQYGFSSGVGPMILTAMLGSTIITGIWHSLNCHKEGCWRISRHKVKGSPWCNGHHEEARTQTTLEDKLDRLIDLLTEQARK